MRTQISEHAMKRFREYNPTLTKHKATIMRDVFLKGRRMTNKVIRKHKLSLNGEEVTFAVKNGDQIFIAKQITPKTILIVTYYRVFDTATHGNRRDKIAVIRRRKQRNKMRKYTTGKHIRRLNQ